MISQSANEYRLERKFLIQGIPVGALLHVLKVNPVCLYEIFHERRINNFYFDTRGFKSYYDNVEGQPQRDKVRVRWYGENTSRLTAPVLEIKRKSGLLGTKLSYALSDIDATGTITRELFVKAACDQRSAAWFDGRIPVLQNSYSRRYFLSAGGKLRVTLDSRLSYHFVQCNHLLLGPPQRDETATVVELKYAPSDEDLAVRFGEGFPFMMTKSSKYVMGLQQTVFGWNL